MSWDMLSGDGEGELRGWTPGPDCPKRQASAGRVANPQNFQKKNCGILYLVQQIRPSWFLDRGVRGQLPGSDCIEGQTSGESANNYHNFQKNYGIFHLTPSIRLTLLLEGEMWGQEPEWNRLRRRSHSTIFAREILRLATNDFLKLSEKTTPSLSRYLSGGCEGRCQGTGNQNPSNPKNDINCSTKFATGSLRTEINVKSQYF